MSTTTPIKPAAAPASERMSVAIARNRRSTRSARRRLQLRDAARLDYQITLEEDESVADVEKAEFLGASADRLSKGDRVAVVCLIPGREFWHERMVISVDPLLQVARTVQIAHVSLVAGIAAMAAPDLSKVVVEKIGELWRLRQGERVVRQASRRSRPAD